MEGDAGELTKLFMQACNNYVIVNIIYPYRVMHHQLLKGICSDGRVQALKEIRCVVVCTCMCKSVCQSLRLVLISYFRVCVCCP